LAGTERNDCFALAELSVGFPQATAFIVQRIIKVLADLETARGVPVRCFTIGKSSIRRQSTVDADEFDPLNRHHLDVRHVSDRWRHSYARAKVHWPGRARDCAHGERGPGVLWRAAWTCRTIRWASSRRSSTRLR